MRTALAQRLDTLGIKVVLDDLANPDSLSQGIQNSTLRLSANKHLDDVAGWRTDMLILTRRVGESLVIGDEVNVTVLGIKGNQVRIGVNAPKNVSVHREEIYQRIQQEFVEPQGNVAE